MQTQAPVARLNVLQALYDSLHDPFIAEGLEKFFQRQKQESIELLLSAVRQHVRDTMKEARLAGKVEAYEHALEDLQRFSEEQLKGASQ